MIKNSFLFLEKISSLTEKKLWQQGFTHWDIFLKTKRIKGFSPLRKAYYDRKIREAAQALLANDSSYFASCLPQKETWRLYPSFQEEACFLDLEVDSHRRIILLGLSDNYQTQFFIQGFNLEKEIIEKEINRHKLIITFNGSSFDLPKLKKQLKINFSLPHIDLKPLCLRLGLQGGLKEIEKKLNLRRPQHLRGNPVDLWKAFHASGDQEWLNLLLEYNREDIENLKWIMDYCYQKLKAKLLSEKIYKEKK